MTFIEYMDRPDVTVEAAPTPFTSLREHVKKIGLVKEQQNPFDIATALHRHLGEIHNSIGQDPNADINVRRLSHQNMLLSYQNLVLVSLFESRKETPNA